MTRHAYFAFGALVLACGSRPEAWDQPFSRYGSESTALGLTGSVAVLDPELQRVTLLSAPSALELRARSFGIGRDLTASQTSLDRKTLFLLTRGTFPQRTASDEPAQLSLFDGGVQPSAQQRYTLRSPMDALVLDPQNEWAVVYGGSGVVVNLNELVLVDLAKQGSAALTEKTLRSFGGDPRRFTFTTPLAVPGADPRRFLIVERDHDLVLIDLSEPESSDITVPLPSADNGSSASSAQVVYDSASATIAVRVTGTTSVLVLQLAEPTESGRDYSVVTNLVDVGGQPSTIDFVHNTQGLRLAALVGTNAVLVDPVTATTQSVTMPAAFTGIRRITNELNPSATPDEGDVALLYGPNITKIAYFTLGGAPGALYRSIDAYDIGVAVKSVLDVPGERYFDHKLLETPSQQFYVLDLSTRQSAPMKTSDGLTLEVAPDGERVWAYKRGSTAFATVDFATLHPVSLYAERPLTAVFDIEASNGARSAFALHSSYEGGLAATVLDANAPSTADARFYSAIELGGIR